MTMLILQSFLLFLVSALLGAGLGHLLHEAYGADLDTVDRPWLRDLGALPASPALPAAPTLMDAGERARLAAALAAPPAAVPTEPAAIVVESVAAAVVHVEPEPQTAAPAAAIEPALVPAAPIEAEPPPMVPPALVSAPPVAPEALERALAADAVGARPSGLTAAEAGAPDDLERIKGIGPKNAKGLHDLGIWHFAQIAAWTPENVAWVGSFLAFPGRIERERWVDQAREFLAEG